MSEKIDLPWPPRELHPNSRVDRRWSTAKRQKYKSDCYFLAKKFNPVLSEKIHLKITFYPPDKRRRDLDGMLSACKYGIDGVAMAWGIDDLRFRPITIDVLDSVKNGKITIEIL